MLRPLATAFGAVVLAGSIGAQASDGEALFVPDLWVPVSEFREVSQASSVTLHVRSDVLTWHDAGGGVYDLRIAAWNGSSASYSTSFTVDVEDGEVEFTAAGAGDYVVVSDRLENDFPIVTHWNNALNGYDDPVTEEYVYRGGQQVGATHALDGVFGYTDTVPGGGYGRVPFLNIVNTDPDHEHAQAGQYRYATNLHAIFSDGTEQTSDKDGEPADADIPAYERYVAENYSLNGVLDSAAIYVSDRTRALCGYPIVHRNHPEAFTSTTPGEMVEDDVPAFQIVHAHIVDIGDMYPQIQGSENSVATFLLPPLWTSDPEEEYPILFHAFYDLHASTFGGTGEIVLEALAHLAQVGRQVVGVHWNGGGAAACQTMHRSAYDNFAVLMEDIETLCKGDPMALVLWGGSRGGTTALLMAANPYYPTSAYAAVFARAGNPQLHPAESLETFVNPAYGLLHLSAIGVTGYVDAWMDGWVDPLRGLSATDYAKWVYLGHTNPLVLADRVSDSDYFVDALDARGTQVVLRAGSHDFSKPFLQTVRYVEHLRDVNVPLHVELSYRFGHSHALGTSPDVEELLNKIFDTDVSVTQVVEHYTPQAGAEWPYGHEQLDTPLDHKPLVVELPYEIGVQQEHTYVVVGEPNALFEIRLTKMDDVEWASGNIVFETSPSPLLLSGTLSDADEWGTEVLSRSDMPAEGAWYYEARYSIDAGTSWLPTGGWLGQGEVSTPCYNNPPCAPGGEDFDDYPVMEVMPTDVFRETNELQASHAGGLCDAGSFPLVE